MLNVDDKEEEDDLATLTVKNEVLIELAGEVLDNISDTRTLIMEEYERERLRTWVEYEEKIARASEDYAKKYKDKQLEFEKERVEMQKSIDEQLDKMIDERKELIDLNEKEKESRKITDGIFEVVKNWTNIDFMFSQLFGMREALRINQHEKELVNKIKCRMMSRVNVIQTFHECNKTILTGVLKSIDEFLDFVELGLDISNRTRIVVALNSIKNVPFWTLKNEELIDEGIQNIEETMLEIRNQLFLLPLCQLRPRKSIRQTLWDEIDPEILSKVLHDPTYFTANFDSFR